MLHFVILLYLDLSLIRLLSLVMLKAPLVVSFDLESCECSTIRRGLLQSPINICLSGISLQTELDETKV